MIWRCDALTHIRSLVPGASFCGSAFGSTPMVLVVNAAPSDVPGSYARQDSHRIFLKV
jgi:hypothetical protein